MYRILQVRSYKAGWYFDRYLRCNRVWGFTKEYPNQWKQAAPFFQSIKDSFENVLPDVYRKHIQRVSSHPEAVVADGVALSSCSINVNYRSYCHMDRGDFREGFSTLTVIKVGDYTGGYFVVPEYAIAVNVCEGDVLYCQSHKLWHGNTKINSLNNGRRISFVTYLKEGLKHGAKQIAKQKQTQVGNGDITTANSSAGKIAYKINVNKRNVSHTGIHAKKIKFKKRKVLSTEIILNKIRVHKTPKKNLAYKNRVKDGMRIIRKPRCQFRAPASNLATQKEISKMSYRQKMTYITQKSKQDNMKEKGKNICKTFLHVYWKLEKMWRRGFIESYNETTGKHKLRFNTLSSAPVFLDIDLSTVQTKSRIHNV
jgi:hypothetical protein